MMGRSVFLFGGQGAQKAGMGADLAAAYPDLGFYREPYCADGLCADLLNPQFEPIHTTRFAQIALCLYQLSVLNILKARGIEADAVLGLSVGEFPAMAASGLYRPEQVLRMVYARADLMSERLRKRKLQGLQEGMLAVLGLEERELTVLLCGFPDCYAANFNARTQIVVSGPAEALDRLAPAALRAGARKAVRLEVEGAFHGPAFEEDVPALQAAISCHETGEARCSQAFNRSGRLMTGAEMNAVSAGFWPEFMSGQMSSPVCLAPCLEALLAKGYRRFAELSPTPVLGPLLRRLDRSAEIIALSDLASLEAFIQEETHG